MTHDDLREMLREHVDDLPPAPDLAGRAWARSRTIRRRRSGTAVATVAVLAVLAGSALLRPGEDRATDPVAPSPTPTPSVTGEPSPTVPGYDTTRGRPDAEENGYPVFWGPTEQQEAGLPLVDSPLPTEIDLSAPAPSIDGAPLDAALAAYAVTDADGSVRLLLLAPDGSLRSVDVNRVAPYLADGGLDVSIARDTLLSPEGDFLAFPQDGSVQVLTLATGAWRTIDTGAAPTAWVRWLGVSDLYLPPTRLGGQGPTYSALDGRRNGSNGTNVPAGPFDPATAVAVGRFRQGPLGVAQTWASVSLPVAEGAPPVSSRALVVEGYAPRDSAVLVLSDAPEQELRPEDCCSITFWLDAEHVVYESPGDPRRLVAWRVGTHQLGVVSAVTGLEPDQRVVSSYVRVWTG